MSTTLKRVVVTGMGTTNPLGADAESTWQAALAGTSGIRHIEAPWVQQYDMPVTFAGQLAQPASEVLTKVEIRRQDPATQYALIAARQAWRDAGSPDIESNRLAVSVGTGIGGVHTLVDAWETLRTKGPRRIFPLSVPMLLVNSPSATVSLELKATAGAHAPVSACASGAESIADGLELIRSDKADIVVAGGTEGAIHPLTIGGFSAMHALSTRNEDPQSASRPYDIDRDGFVMGEGSAILVLEEYEHAVARGAHIYAELVAAGLSSDAYHVAAPEPEGAGAALSIQRALSEGDIDPASVVHVNAHATSTPAGDGAEAKAIRAGLGPHADHACLTATKSMTGHLLGAAGALESVFTILALRDRLVPATQNLENLDPQIDLDIVRGQNRALPAGDVVALNNSFGFGGHNVTLAFRSVS
ncbi:3-oxoacyl-[acyl-carrier-protein] synthase 2 [Dermatophilus congolensis]|uniref:3-oxoacyl-[acyl-carrier-protein] synthase 2 n=1 Tax=Dermatophilus congolensis TaxID=1863 RepID=A0AA46H087_9MICO|nr:beta-ketoacyl-ACP synthase II [Dermatophilus congolensis]STD08117.1 3-oxoacyl-[acyl-carrier-protein] synthase 2 [Dermatophilus congolensis]